MLKTYFLSLVELLAFLRRNNAKEKTFKRNYQHFIKMDLLNNDSGNVNKVNVLISLIAWFPLRSINSRPV